MTHFLRGEELVYSDRIFELITVPLYTSWGSGMYSIGSHPHFVPCSTFYRVVLVEVRLCPLSPAAKLPTTDYEWMWASLVHTEARPTQIRLGECHIHCVEPIGVSVCMRLNWVLEESRMVPLA